MKNLRSSLSKTVPVALTAVLAVISLAPPAHAVDDSTVAIVEQAERAHGIADDPASVPSLIEKGSSTTVSGLGRSLSIVSGVASSRSEPSSVSYTVESEDSSTARFASVFASPATSSASWDFGRGHELLRLADGRVSVADGAGRLAAGVDAPWAVDANGKPVETYYTTAGTTLVQHVVFTSSTAFPVVADPTVHTYFGYYTVNLNKSESTVAVSTVGACAALFARAPYPGSLVGVGCGVFAAFSTVQLAGGKCLVVHIVGFPPALSSWWPTFPKC